MARIAFEVSTTAVEISLWVRAQGKAPEAVAIVDGRGEANLPEGRHDLFWSIAGAPHARFSLIARQAGLTVLDVKDQIASCVLDASGAERFTVKGRESLKRLKERKASNVTQLRPEWAEADIATRRTGAGGRRARAAG
jgi:hypothetical protein